MWTSALLAPLHAYAQLPDMGDGGALSLSEERHLGDEIIREVYRDPDYMEDPVLLEYVQGVWQPLLKAAGQRGELSAEMRDRFAWDVLLIRDRTINAFALPGGYIGVHLGLIGTVSSRDELAAVLGHELSHVTQRHIARMFDNQSRQVPMMIIPLILAALAASKSADAAGALATLGPTLAMKNQLAFSRNMEREADRVGYGVMADAGFAPQGFSSMFEKLQYAARINDNGDYPYLRSHPLTTERIADAQARALDQKNAAPVPVTAYQAMISARAKVLAKPDTSLQQAMLDAPQSNNFAGLRPEIQAGTLYAAALTASQKRDWARARNRARQLEAQVSGDPQAARLARLLAVEIELGAGDAAMALTYLQPLQARASQSRPEMLYYAQARIQQGRVQEVIPLLQSWVVGKHPQDATVWLTLAQALGVEGQTLRQIRADGEARAAQKDYVAARDRFKAGQDLARKTPNVDHIDASIIDARLREMEARIRQQEKEERAR